MKKEFIIGSGVIAAIAIVIRKLYEANMVAQVAGESMTARLIGAIVGSLLLPGIMFLLWLKYREKSFAWVFMILFALLAIVQLIK